MFRSDNMREGRHDHRPSELASEDSTGSTDTAESSDNSTAHLAHQLTPQSALANIIASITLSVLTNVISSMLINDAMTCPENDEPSQATDQDFTESTANVALAPSNTEDDVRAMEQRCKQEMGRLENTMLSTTALTYPEGCGPCTRKALKAAGNQRSATRYLAASALCAFSDTWIL